MVWPNVFDPAVVEGLLARLDSLRPDARPLWGRMNAAQMLAHGCLPYEQIEGIRGGGPWLLCFLARLLAKRRVFDSKPFRHGIATPKEFMIADERDFQREKTRLVDFVRKHHGMGAAAFEGRVHASWGRLTAQEWNTLLWKHLDHHLRQFGA